MRHVYFALAAQGFAGAFVLFVRGYGRMAAPAVAASIVLLLLVFVRRRGGGIGRP